MVTKALVRTRMSPEYFGTSLPYNPSPAAAFSSNNRPWRMYFRSMAVLRWPVCSMMTRSPTAEYRAMKPVNATVLRPLAGHVACGRQFLAGYCRRAHKLRVPVARRTRLLATGAGPTTIQSSSLRDDAVEDQHRERCGRGSNSLPILPLWGEVLVLGEIHGIQVVRQRLRKLDL